MTPLHIFAQELDVLLKQYQHITLISHRHPDGDALGCLEGMRGLLTKNYPHLTVLVVVPQETIDTHISWILGDTVDVLPPSTDLVLILDTALLARTALPVEAFSGYHIMAIDHHQTSADTIQWYNDPTAPSATILLTEMARILDWGIDALTATALLLGIYTDTGCFIHGNTNPFALSTAAHLVSLGANQAAIAQRVYGNYSLEYLHQLGRGLLDIRIVDRIAILCLQSDIEWWLKSQIIGYLSGLENVDIACVLRPEEGMISGSLRTRLDRIDVHSIAQRFWGGGHVKAAGFLIPWSIQDGIIEYNGKKQSVEEFVKNFIHV